MKKILILGLILSLVFLTGCKHEIETDLTDCNERMSGLLSGVTNALAESSCEGKCRADGYEYETWKCSRDDILVCVCN
jgi:type III secretory pathway lipoprotein EscJ